MDSDYSSAAISVRGLKKSYGKTLALRGVDLEIQQGEIFALLGPNGAGKTTIVEILEGFRHRDEGDVEVLGIDPNRQPMALKIRIGIVLQSTGVERYLSVAETVKMYSSYYPHPRPVGEILGLVGLEAKRDERVLRLSGGQQRRLDVAIALAGDPDLLFLDEPTTGFDPSARREVWEVIKNLQSLGKTVVLTTHFMDEAQYLADRLPPLHLGARMTAAHAYEVKTTLVTKDLFDLTSWAMSAGVDLEDLRVDRPTLEDVYLELTTEGSASNLKEVE